MHPKNQKCEILSLPFVSHKTPDDTLYFLSNDPLNELKQIWRFNMLVRVFTRARVLYITTRCHRRNEEGAEV